MITLQVRLEDDPADVARWVDEFEAHRRSTATSRLQQPRPDEEAAAPADPELEQELARFRMNWPAFSERFTQVHEGLVALGYTPVLAKKRKPTSVRNYIAYHLPNGNRVFENNSSTAYIVGTERVARLRDRHEDVKVSGSALSIHFDSTAKVDLILTLAREELEGSGS